jgi:hypothetical protein
MTDKEIDKWLNKINEEEYFLLITSLNSNLSELETAKIYSDNLDIDYLEKDLGLVIKLIEQSKDGHFVKLSRKGNKIIRNGGWIEYLKKERNKNFWKNIKKEFRYWFNIVIPILSIIFAYKLVDKDNEQIKAEILKDIQYKYMQKPQVLKQTIEQNPKKSDSVPLKTE